MTLVEGEVYFQRRTTCEPRSGREGSIPPGRPRSSLRFTELPKGIVRPARRHRAPTGQARRSPAPLSSMPCKRARSTQVVRASEKVEAPAGSPRRRCHRAASLPRHDRLRHRARPGRDRLCPRDERLPRRRRLPARPARQSRHQPGLRTDPGDPRQRRHDGANAADRVAHPRAGLADQPGRLGARGDGDRRSARRCTSSIPRCRRRRGFGASIAVQRREQCVRPSSAARRS